MPRPRRPHVAHHIPPIPTRKTRKALDQVTVDMTPEVVDTRGDFLIASRCGWSPDGLIGDDGAIELKCPRPANHWSAWRDAEDKVGLAAVPSHHRAQLLHAFVVGGPALDWIDWVSYSPVFPPPLKLLVIRVARARCHREIAAYRTQLVEFLEGLEVELEAMRQECGVASAGAP